MNHKKVLFVNFSLNERTKRLSKYSAIQNGFENYLELDGQDSFYLKMKKFFKICNQLKNYDFFVRSDADRIIMPGINNFIENYYSMNTKPWFFQGTGIEYVMNMQKRNATPNIYSNECIKYINENFEKIVPDDRKPETALSLHIRNKIDRNLFKSIKSDITNLHEFEQHPKKIVNAYLNRLWRGHRSYYKKAYLESLPEDYKDAIFIAEDIFKNISTSDKFFYVDEKLMLKIKPDFKTTYPGIENVESLYRKYVDRFEVK